MKKVILGIAIVFVLLLIVLSNNKRLQKREAIAQQNQLVEQVVTDIEAISVEAGSFYYKPNLIKVKKGQRVMLSLKSVDMMHDFNIDELGIKIPVTKANDIAVIQFVADKTGEFEFYCSVSQHRKIGQVGKLIVED